jgi:hypothetical protein
MEERRACWKWLEYQRTARKDGDTPVFSAEDQQRIDNAWDVMDRTDLSGLFSEEELAMADAAGG